jgi:serine protease
MKKLLSLAVVLSFCSLVFIPNSTVHSQSRAVKRHPYVENEIIVKLRADAGFVAESAVADQILPTTATRAERLAPETGDGIFVMELGGGTTVEEAIRRAEADPRVEYAEPNYLISTEATPNDTFFDRQWGLLNTGSDFGKAGADIGAAQLWDLTQGSDDVVVAVTDTGIDLTHPDLSDNAWVNPREVAGDGLDNDGNGLVDDINGWNFRGNNSNFSAGADFHGTHVSGTVGAVGNNGRGVSGVAWRVKLMALKFIEGRSGETADAIKAINYAVDQRRRGVNVRVINASWGDGGPGSSLRNAIRDAGEAGILFVCAAGNESTDNDADPDYPSVWSKDISSVISVTALDRADNLASFSNYGHTTVNIGAPGVQVLSTLPGGGYGFSSGTSMATPHISGAAVLIWTREPQLTPAEVRERIVRSSVPVLSLASKATSSARANVFNASTGGTPPAPSLGIGQVSANKKVLTVDGLRFISGSTGIEINSVPLNQVKYSSDYALSGGSVTRMTVKLGKPAMNTLLPKGVAKIVTVVDLLTGERYSVSYAR